jgi:hypothetical protein
MQKIPTLFLRDELGKNRAVARNDVNPECCWVINGEGVSTVKFDGSACLVKEGRLFKRHELKEGGSKPGGWIHWTFDQAQQSGHGWVPVGEGSEDQYHREAWANTPIAHDCTCELVGPKIQRNPQHLSRHELWEHGSVLMLPDPARNFEAIREALLCTPVEGIVWHRREDGAMAKIKRRDFGIPWPV